MEKLHTKKKNLKISSIYQTYLLTVELTSSLVRFYAIRDGLLHGNNNF